jgi:hypothetical protein
MIRSFNSIVLGFFIFAVAGCGSESPPPQETTSEKEPTSGAVSESNPEAEKAAIETAQSWLDIVDGGKFEESWDEAAGLFKSGISKEKWGETLKAFRTPLGKVISRKLATQQYATSLPGAPDGEYVVIQYNTTFENKKKAVETITPMLDKDGKWRVSGYYIK